MADQSYTNLALQQAAAHAVGLDVTNFDLTTGLTAQNVVNDSIHHLWTYRRWRWRQSSEALSLTQSQNYIALASDYGRTLSLEGYPQTYYRVMPASLPQINLMRQRTYISGFDLWWAVSWTAQASVTASQIAKLEIFPTPAASVSNALSHIYEKRIPKVSGNTDLVDMPVEYYPALEQLVRCFAKRKTWGVDDRSEGDYGFFKQLLDPLIQEDAMSQPYTMPVPGTVQYLTRRHPTDDRFFPTTSAVVS